MKQNLIKEYFLQQVKEAYINFLNHCYIDTEVEMKEIYTSNHMWSLFEKSFIVDMGWIANATHDRSHADTVLENYVTNCLMNIITTFFSSPFSDQSTTVQVIYSLFFSLRGKNCNFSHFLFPGYFHFFHNNISKIMKFEK